MLRTSENQLHKIASATVIATAALPVRLLRPRNVATKLLFLWTKEVKIARGGVRAVGQVIKKFPFV